MNMLQLTPRQKEVIRLVAQGMTALEIAEKLCISEHTVRRHRNSIREALGAKNLCEAVAIACRCGLA